MEHLASARDVVAVSLEQRREGHMLLPLSEVVDEHYTVYFCLGDRLAVGRQMPRFCT